MLFMVFQKYTFFIIFNNIQNVAVCIPYKVTGKRIRILNGLGHKMRQGFNYTKEIPKYTKENMRSDCFGSHFSQNGAINIMSRPYCHTFNYLSIDTHIGYSHSHMAIWSDCGHGNSIKKVAIWWRK